MGKRDAWSVGIGNAERMVKISIAGLFPVMACTGDVIAGGTVTTQA